MKFELPSPRARLALAIGADTLTAVVRTGSTERSETVAYSIPEALDDVAPALQAAFDALAVRLRIALGRDPRGMHTTIALLPPLVEARLIALPPLRRDEAEAVIRRDAARHFVGGASAKVVAVRTTGTAHRKSAESEPLFAAAASASLVEAIHYAASSIGLQVSRLMPAHAGWIAAAERQTRRNANAPLAVIAITGDTAHVLRIQQHAVTQLRRIPSNQTHDITLAAERGPGVACVFAEGAAADAIARALADHDWTVVRGGSAVRVAAIDGVAGKLELLPASVLHEQEQQRNVWAARLAAAALLLLLSTAGVHLWGAQRELQAVRAQRAALRPQVAPLLATRDSLDRLRERTDALRSLGAAPQWTRALFDIALLLPPDAHLIGLRATGDTLVISAQGTGAGAALQALRSAASLKDVRLEGPVERDLEDGTTALERFTLQARVVTDTAARRP